ncbi:hypothetical protein D9M72_416970 [compost metagenome]
MFLRHDQRGIDLLLTAEAVAGRAGAEGVVEGEQARLDLGDREAGDRAGEFFREQHALMSLVERLVGRTAGGGFFRRQRLVGELGHGETIGQRQAGLQAVGEARGKVGPDDDTVDHHIDVVLVFLVECRNLGDLVEGAVNLDALKALLHQFGEFLLVFALAAANERRKNVKARAFAEFQHAVDHLADRLAFDRKARRRRIGNADAREEQAHVVVDLGDRADRRARVARGRLLLDRDRRRQAVDLVDIRLLHHLEELTRIGRQALDIAALPFGIDRIEGERGLAGAGKSGHHDQLVARQIEVDAFQIVLARTTNGDGLEFTHRKPAFACRLKAPYVMTLTPMSRRNRQNRRPIRVG